METLNNSNSRDKSQQIENQKNIDIETGGLPNPPISRYSSSKSKKTKRFIFVWVMLLVIFATACFIFVKHITDKKREERQKLENLRKQVDAMYVDPTTKSEIRGDVDDDVVDQMLRQINRGDEVFEDIYYELWTIGLYLNHKTYVENCQDEKFDFERDTDYWLLNLNDCIEHLDEYTVEGLRSTIEPQMYAVLDEYNFYVQLKDELSTFTDYMNFNEDYYTLQIRKITHIKNRETLEELYTQIINKRDLLIFQEYFPTEDTSTESNTEPIVEEDTEPTTTEDPVRDNTDPMYDVDNIRDNTDPLGVY